MVQNSGTISFLALASFHAVFRTGGIAAAAEHLGVAKSGVSRHVALLEQRLGVKLLEQGGRGVRVTPAGERLAQRVGSILAEIDLLDDFAREESAQVSGQVTIAATPEVGGLVARHLFPQILSRHPGISLVMRPAYAFEDMQDPGIDLAIRVGTFQDDRLVAHKIGAFQRWLVASPGYLGAIRLERASDLQRLECLTFRADHPSATWSVKGPDGRVEEVPVKGRLAVRSFAILRDLVLEGAGISFLPHFMVEDDLAAGRLTRGLKDHASPDVPVYLAFRPGVRKIARVSAVLDDLAQLAPPMLGG
ncbi:LysR family transcriptional regulator [Devosia salina]|uniref:LysR family transcriptional regulator n=1 Tax=Devosia salina TaxID=2860336 RepID=A0ABX8WGD4_9HYPH|nr:LysR family transcriptional regulator [Devosia salina]QYO77071.1 LysR family transcriptional regulator [Devosia salina]